MYNYLATLDDVSGEWSNVAAPTPMYVFSAQSDVQALGIATQYLAHKNKRYNLRSLGRITQGLMCVPVDIERGPPLTDKEITHALKHMLLHIVESGNRMVEQLQPYNPVEHEKEERQKKEWEARNEANRKRAQAIQVPAIGDEIYVTTSLYLSHGKDDVLGGLATVTNVTKRLMGAELPYHMVSVKEHPGHHYNWEGSLALQQEKLKGGFGSDRAREDPDTRPEFNEW